MPKWRKTFTFRQENRNSPQQPNQQARRVRHIKEQQQDDEEDPEEETLGVKAAFYIKKTDGGLGIGQHCETIYMKEINNVSLNKDTVGEFWVKTKYRNSDIDWLADTGSPR